MIYVEQKSKEDFIDCQRSGGKNAALLNGPRERKKERKMGLMNPTAEFMVYSIHVQQ